MKRTPSLNQMIHQALADLDPEAAQSFKNAVPTDDMDDATSIRTANRYFRVQLGLRTSDTINERECLIDNISLDDWWRNFQNHVVKAFMPAQVAHD